MKNITLTGINQKVDTEVSKNLTITSETNTQDALNYIETQLSLKGPRRRKRAIIADSVSNLTFNPARDTIDTISDDSGPLFYVIRNKLQLDPTTLINDNKLRSTDYVGGISGYSFYSYNVFLSNTVAADITLTEYPGYDVVIFDRIHDTHIREYPQTMYKPFMRVFIDKDGYLNALFTRYPGGTSVAKSDKPIPLNERVHIQANQQGNGYEVGWKSYSSNTQSTGYNSYQIDLVDFQKGSILNFKDIERKFLLLTNIWDMTNFYWNTYLPLFSKYGATDVSDMLVYQGYDMLILNNEFVGKIIAEINGEEEFFKIFPLKAYIDKDKNVQAVDVRIMQ